MACLRSSKQAKAPITNIKRLSAFGEAGFVLGFRRQSLPGARLGNGLRRYGALSRAFAIGRQGPLEGQQQPLLPPEWNGPPGSKHYILHPIHSHTPRPMTHSRSSPLSHGISSVNMVTPWRYVQGSRDKSVPQKVRLGPKASKTR